MSTHSAALPRPASRRRLRVRSLPRPRPELLALLILAAALDLWSLSRNGWANDYYAAAVRSMGSSWHDFLYGSFDPSGVMTVDKPPLAFWVQALSVRVFGYHSLSILVPQALEGVATVALAYDLTRRRFGRAAGGVAGLVLALTPITVAISRHNNPDAMLVLCVTAALWAMVRALEDGRTKWVVWCGVFVGLGFEAKMGAALLVVPGLAAAWLWVAPRGRRAALRAAAAGGAAMTAVGLAWPLLVTLTPASDRPWISGTSDNSVWSLMFGYNGLGRLDGQAGGPGGGMGGGGGGFFGGSTGPFRLLNTALGGQAGWLLGFAAVGAIGLAIATRLRRNDPRTGWIVAVGGAFAATAVAFSFASGIFHPYYVSELAPFAAVLVGGSVALLVRRDRLARVLAPAAVLAGAGTELAVLHGQPGQLTWLKVVLPFVAIGGAAALVAAVTHRERVVLLGAVLAVLLIAPATWSAQTLGYATSSTFPAGGPAGASSGGGLGGPGGSARGGSARGGFGGPPGGFAGGPPSGSSAPGGPGQSSAQGGFPGGPPSATSTRGGSASGGLGGGMFGGNDASLTAIARYVKAHGGGTIAVSSQSQAAALIIQSGTKVAGIGGFSGRESSVSIAWLASEVQAGKIRWVLADGTSTGSGRSAGGGLAGDDRAGSSAAETAAAKVGKKVTIDGTTVYDLSGRAAALKALAS